MKILFVLRHSGYVRNYESALRTLADRGHEIHLAFEHGWPHDFPELAEQLASGYESVTFGGIPDRFDTWWELAHRVRYTIDYLRYLTPAYRDAPRVRARGEKYTPGWIIRLMRLPGFRTQTGVRLVRRIATAMDRAIPTGLEVDEFVRGRDPDLVLVSPLLAGPSQTEYVRSAKKLGRHTALPVHSWDNLSNKGALRERPERIYVWNEIQRNEAIELHDVDPARIVVVGAHTYDHWFRWRPSTTRDEFCARVGLDPARPFVLYLCSSGFIVPDEIPVIRRWLEALRPGPLAEVGVLVRPHPLAGVMWPETAPEGFEDAVVWPPQGADPRTKRHRDDFYDSLYHSAAVVGVNTSAMIEAAIVGRRTFGFRLPELFGGQEGTLHFHYLRAENGGPLSLADSLEEHVAQLAQALEGGDPDGWNEPFLASFLRPRGLHQDATPVLVAELEELMASPRPAPGRHPLRAAFAFLLYPFAWLVSRLDSGQLRDKSRRRRFEEAVGFGVEDAAEARKQWQEARERWDQARRRQAQTKERLEALKEERRRAKAAKAPKAMQEPPEPRDKTATKP
jgi:hypothetical protein